MRISGIYNNYRPYGTAYRSKPSFHGEECEEGYGPYVVSMAKKYLYVKDNSTWIWKEVYEDDDMGFTYNDIIALIKKLKTTYANKDKKI